MRVLLVDPYVPNSKGLNLGLGWLAASIRAAGHEIYVLDLNNRDIAANQAVLREQVLGFRPDIVGINILSNTYLAVMDMFKDLAIYFSGIKIVGGPQMAYEKEKVLLANPNIDFALVGEAEESFLELMDKLSHEGDLSLINGLIYRREGRIITNPPRQPVKDLNKLPMPDYKLFGIKEILVPYRVSTSRGCPFRCVFCNPFMGGKWRSRDLGKAIEELKIAKEKYKIKSFTVCEPVFNLTADRVSKFCKLLIRERINLPWSCSSGLRADRINDEMVCLMKQTGCHEIKIGVETLVPEIFAGINKGEKIADIERAVKICKRNGMKISGSFIVGLPNDTYATARRNLQLARKLGFDETTWSLLIPYPGTAAYEWVKQNGRIYYDYKDADQYAGQEEAEAKIKVSFDTADFPVKERLKILKEISFREKIHVWTYVAGVPVPFNFLLLFWNLFRHDPFNIAGNLHFIVTGMIGRLRQKQALQATSSGLIFEALPEGAQ